jgi:hypothetical protein
MCKEKNFSEDCCIGCTVTIVVLALLFIICLGCTIGFGVAWGVLKANCTMTHH